MALSGESSNIKDAYEAKGFDDSLVPRHLIKILDIDLSHLTVPLKNHEDEIIGVMQLINATNTETGETGPFSAEMEDK